MISQCPKNHGIQPSDRKTCRSKYTTNLKLLSSKFPYILTNMYDLRFFKYLVYILSVSIARFSS